MVFEDVRKDIHLAYVNLMKSYCYPVSLMAHNSIKCGIIQADVREPSLGQVIVRYIEDIIWPPGDTKFLFEF